MKNRKINLDRPQLNSKEIQGHKNFNQVLSDYHVMSKPFYKSNWFYGTTGLASIGLIIGGTFAFQDPESGQNPNLTYMNTDAPPDLVVPDNSLISMNTNQNDVSKELVKETVPINNQREELNEETYTIESSDLDKIVESDNVPEVELSDNVVIKEDNKTVDNGFNLIDLDPRIGGKLNGSITKDELFDNKGITTQSDVSIIHFELHLIDGLGGKVFEEEGNQLNEEMKNAINKIGQGGEIYFENIKGQTTKGIVVRLNPLRYVLMN